MFATLVATALPLTLLARYVPEVVVTVPATVLEAGISATGVLASEEVLSLELDSSLGTVVVAPALIAGAITSDNANAPVNIFLMILDFIILSSIRDKYLRTEILKSRHTAITKLF